MIVPIQMFGAECDHCKDSWRDEHYGWVAMLDKQSIRESIIDADWHIQDDKCYCPNCFIIDDDDKLVLKELPVNP